jgi:hypothetical protein
MEHQDAFDPVPFPGSSGIGQRQNRQKIDEENFGEKGGRHSFRGKGFKIIWEFLLAQPEHFHQ